MKCSKCKSEISNDNKFCPNCGLEIIRIIDVKKQEKKDTSNTSVPKNNTKLLSILVVVLMVATLAWGIDKSVKNDRLEKMRKEMASQSNSTSSYSSTSSSNGPTSKEKRESFALSIKESLNAPGLPLMCEKVYFNNLGELIIEVNGEWLILDESLKVDMIYALKELLKSNKDDLDVEGYGQFFSTSGQGLESFYVK